MAFKKVFDNISSAIYIREVKLGQKLAPEETFKMACYRSILAEVQGHKIS